MNVPVLHVVTDDGVLARADFVDVARCLLARGGADVALHVRGPATDGLAMYERTCALVDAAAETGAQLVVNDRIDVALATGVAVQLGRRSLRLADARALVGDAVGIGVSTHTHAEAAQAAGPDPRRADWIFAGTIWASASHPDGTARGAEAIEGAAGAVGGRVPVIAIGGVTADRATQALRAGAHGVAAIRGIWGAGDPVGALSRYLQAWTSVRTMEAR